MHWKSDSANNQKRKKSLLMPFQGSWSGVIQLCFYRDWNKENKGKSFEENEVNCRNLWKVVKIYYYNLIPGITTLCSLHTDRISECMMEQKNKELDSHVCTVITTFFFIS